MSQSPKSIPAGAQKKIYVGNLHWSIDNPTFKQILESQSGKTVLSANVGAPKRPTDNNCGYGFGEFETRDDASDAINLLDGYTVQGRALKASFAGQPRAQNTCSNVTSQASPSSSTPAATPAPSNQTTQEQPLEIFHIPNNAPIIDIGANLASHRFSHTTPALLNRAHKAGVSHIVITGTSVSASENAASVVQKHDNSHHVKLYSTAGVHPHDASKTVKDTSNWQTRLERLIEAHPKKVVAVGECGLDYNRMFSSVEDQRSVFRAQMDLALKHNLPVFLHCRDADNPSPSAPSAHKDFVSILSDYPSVKKCVHCYTDSSRQHLQDLIDLDCYIGLTGWITDPRPSRGGAELAELVAQNMIPTGRLMIETDAPFLKPWNIPGQMKKKGGAKRENEPMYLGWVAKSVSECLEVSVEAVAKETTETAIEFFGLT